MIKIIIRAKSAHTWFGPYSDKETAVDAKKVLTTKGDSLGMTWRANELKITRARFEENAKGEISITDI